jgi:hypothetical protein
MKTRTLIIGSIFASASFLALATQQCYMTCGGDTSMDSCGTGPGCQTSGSCYHEYLPPGYALGNCSTPSNDWEDGCDDGAPGPMNTTTYFGTCSTSCVCQIPPNAQPFNDHGDGLFGLCWQDCCTPG